MTYAIVEMVHQAMVQLETFLTHESLLDSPGPSGFRVSIRDIDIFEVKYV